MRHRYTGLDTSADQPIARVRNQRRPGVRDQRHDFAVFEAFHKTGSRTFGIMLVIGDERTSDSVNGQESGRHTCILAGNDVSGGQDIEGAERYVAGVTDRRRDYIQTRAWCLSTRFTRLLAVVRL